MLIFLFMGIYGNFYSAEFFCIIIYWRIVL